MAQFVAAEEGDLERVQQLVTRENVDEIDILTTFGGTVLHIACMEGHVNVTHWLVSTFGNLIVNVRDTDSWTALHFAAHNSHSRCIQILLDAGADPRIADDDGATPLHVSHSVECTTLLLSAYPDGVYVTDEYGNSPLHRFAEHGRVEECLILLKTGCVADITCLHGFTPLYWAFREHYRNVAEMLIEYGAQLERVKLDYNMESIPDWAISFVACRKACRLSSYAVLELARRGSPVIGGNRRDALWLVARRVWNTRQDESWNE